VLATVAVSSLLAAALIAALLLVYRQAFLSFGGLNMLILLCAAAVVLLGWQRISAEMLRAFGELRWASLFSGGQTGGALPNVLFVVGIGAAVVLSFRLELEAVVAMHVAVLVVTLPLALLALRSTIAVALRDGGKVSTSDAELTALLGAGGLLCLNQLLGFASQQFDILLGGTLLDSTELGEYGAAKRSLLLALMPIQMAMMTIMPSIPRLKAQQKTAELQRLLRSVATLAAIPSLAAALVLALFPDQVLSLVFGESYSDARGTMLMLVAGHLPLVLLGNPPYILAVSGFHRTVLAVNIASIVVMVMVGAIGAAWFGPAGLASGCAAGIAMQSVLLWAAARIKLGVWTHIGKPVLVDSEGRAWRERS